MQNASKGLRCTLQVLGKSAAKLSGRMLKIHSHVVGISCIILLATARSQTLFAYFLFANADRQARYLDETWSEFKPRMYLGGGEISFVLVGFASLARSILKAQHGTVSHPSIAKHVTCRYLRGQGAWTNISEPSACAFFLRRAMARLAGHTRTPLSEDYCYHTATQAGSCHSSICRQSHSSSFQKKCCALISCKCNLVHPSATNPPV